MASDPLDGLLADDPPRAFNVPPLGRRIFAPLLSDGRTSADGSTDPLSGEQRRARLSVDPLGGPGAAADQVASSHGGRVRGRLLAQGSKQGRGRLDRVGPLGRVWPALDRDHVVRPDQGGERRNVLVGDVTAGRRIATHGAGRCPPRPDRPRSASPPSQSPLSSTTERAAASSSSVRANASAPTSPSPHSGYAARTAAIASGISGWPAQVGSPASCEVYSWGSTGGSTRTSVAGRSPAAGQGRRRHRAPAVPDDLQVVALETGGSDEGGDICGVLAEPVMTLPVSGHAMPACVDGDHPATGRGERRPDPPPRGRGRVTPWINSSGRAPDRPRPAPTTVCRPPRRRRSPSVGARSAAGHGGRAGRARSSSDRSASRRIGFSARRPTAGGPSPPWPTSSSSS